MYKDQTDHTNTTGPNSLLIFDNLSLASSTLINNGKILAYSSILVTARGAITNNAQIACGSSGINIMFSNDPKKYNINTINGTIVSYPIGSTLSYILIGRDSGTPCNLKWFNNI